MLIALLWAVFALLALVGLVAVDWRDVPPIAGTTAFILTLTALAAAILR
jgi:hypothetical protein